MCARGLSALPQLLLCECMPFTPDKPNEFIFLHRFTSDWLIFSNYSTPHSLTFLNCFHTNSSMKHSRGSFIAKKFLLPEMPLPLTLDQIDTFFSRPCSGFTEETMLKLSTQRLISEPLRFSTASSNTKYSVFFFFNLLIPFNRLPSENQFLPGKCCNL